ncbi:MAG: hypothetical protein WDW38_006271 [Sanguina aurantia]
MYALGYLTTGCVLALLGQVATNMAASHPSAQLLGWTKYAVTCAITAVIATKPSLRPPSAAATHAKSDDATSLPSRGRMWSATVTIGVLDVLSYSVNTLGFAKCGSAISM